MVKSDEAFMRELQPHLESAGQKICSALEEIAGRQSTKFDPQNITELLKDEASYALKVMAEKGRMEGREEQESTLRRARIRRKAQLIADQIIKGCGLDSRQHHDLQKRIREEVEGVDNALFILLETDRQEERARAAARGTVGGD